ncbi:MAG: hypothetical protein ACTSVI_14495 [Promethearchaeota archaeon]
MTDKFQGFKKEVVVDFWSTNLHGEEIGIYEHKRKEASSRSFTKDLELIGKVIDDNGESVFGYRKNAWDPPHSKDELEYYTKKRLIIRWFKKGDDGKVTLIGTIEEMTLDSIRKSMISDDPLHSFKISLTNYPYLVTLTKEHARLPGRIGEMWGFALMTDEKSKGWEIFLLDEKRFTIGTDFDAKKDHMKNIIVKLDEHVLNIGGKVKITFFNKRLHDFKPFYNTILLFSMLFKFKKALREKIVKARKLMNEMGKRIHVDANEIKLMHNPRMFKR